MNLRIAGLVAILAALGIGGTVLALEEPLVPLPDHVRADSIVVEKSKHRMSLFKNGELLRTYRVALGRGVPSGTWLELEAT
jgi:hypothetical protein